MLNRRTAGWLAAALFIVSAAGCSGDKPEAETAADGGSPATASAGTPAASAATAGGTIDAAALLELLDDPAGPAVLDVRSSNEFDAGHIPGSIHIPYDEIEQRIGELEPYRDKGLVVYCRTGRRAGIAEAALARAGFERVWDLEGHMVEWQGQGLPLAVPALN